MTKKSTKQEEIETPVAPAEQTPAENPAIAQLQVQIETYRTENMKLKAELEVANQVIAEFKSGKGIIDLKATAKPMSEDEMRMSAMISSIGKEYKDYTPEEKKVVELEIRRYLNRDGGKVVTRGNAIPYFREGITPAQKERAIELCKRTGRDVNKPKWDLEINLPM